MFRSVFFISSMLVFIAAATRILPHPPNFTPLLAISLFAGAYMHNRLVSALIPVAAMFVSDLVLGFHDLMIPIYAIMIGLSFWGRGLLSHKTPVRIGMYTISGSLVFFLVTNFLVWLTSGMYSLSFAGLIQCYAMAIPFFQNQLAGDVLFTAFLFGSMYVIERSSLIPVRVHSGE